MERNIIKAKEAERLFKQNGIELTFDGIGNCSITYVWDDGYTKQNISLGGYCDMEPFKWDVADKWQVGKGRNPGVGTEYSIMETKTHFVEYGMFYDKDANQYFWDKEYVDAIVAAKTKLVEQLPGFKVYTDAIHERFLDSMYSFVVEKAPTPIYSEKSNKWKGTLMFRGKKYRTKVHSSFFDAKAELDEILKNLIKR